MRADSRTKEEVGRGVEEEEEAVIKENRGTSGSLSRPYEIPSHSMSFALHAKKKNGVVELVKIDYPARGNRIDIVVL